MSLCFVVFFFSSRRRHTRCALVTGVQTCALPICQAHVLGVAVGLGVHDHRLDAEFAAGALDAQRDLAAVGDQDFFKHMRNQPMTNSGWPYSTGSPFSTRLSLMTPDLSASISFSCFMASKMHSGSPSLTDLPTSLNGAAHGLVWLEKVPTMGALTTWTCG